MAAGVTGERSLPPLRPGPTRPLRPGPTRPLRLGLLGCGSVGAPFAALLRERAGLLRSLGREVRLAGVLVRDPGRKRGVPGLPLTADPGFVADCDVLVEALGGVAAPLALVRPHLERGRPLITANKALLAGAWDTLRSFAAAGQIHAEACVMSGTPVIGALQGTLRASRLVRLQANLNATCSYLLGEMERGASYREALARAQALGYAEDPPTLDVSGQDAAHKLRLLAHLLLPGPLESLTVQGIEGLDAAEVRAAAGRGGALRLIAELWEQGGAYHGRVAPAELPREHPLAQPWAARAGLVFTGEPCGRLLFAGERGGGAVTAGALLGDLVRLLQGSPGHRPHPGGA